MIEDYPADQDVINIEDTNVIQKNGDAIKVNEHTSIIINSDSNMTEQNNHPIVLSPEGTPYTVHFGYNKHQLTENQKAALQNFIKKNLRELLAEKLELHLFIVTGYTDSKKNTEAYNFKLGQRRAEAVAEILTEAGAKKTRVVSKGECCQMETSELSRRVEIEIKKT